MSVDIDFSRLPSGTSGWIALVNHVLALGDLSEVDWLELKGRLSFETRSERKRSAVMLARAMLGLANRSPDVAAKHLDGSGVVFVGVDGQSATSANRLVGAERVDGAVLHDAVEPYVGDDGPSWDYLFIDHPRGLVMAVVVEPPQWGDRIHACRREYSDTDGSLNVRDGDLFVRVPGKTRPATSHDIAMLERRRDRAPAAGAQVRVEYDDKFDRVDSVKVTRLFAREIEEQAASLLADLQVGSPAYSKSSTLGALLGKQDRRSTDLFRRSVDEWRDKAVEKCESVATEFLRHTLARGKLAIFNESDRYLEAVRLRVQFPVGITVLMASDTGYCHHGGPFNPSTLLPKPPVRWGSFSIDSLAPSPSSLERIRTATQPVLAPGFSVEENDDGSVLTWDVGALHPRGREVCNELLAVVTDEHVDAFAAHWRVTARRIDHVFEGEARLTCAQQPDEHLVWSRASDA